MLKDNHEWLKNRIIMKLHACSVSGAGVPGLDGQVFPALTRQNCPKAMLNGELLPTTGQLKFLKACRNIILSNWRALFVRWFEDFVRTHPAQPNAEFGLECQGDGSLQHTISTKLGRGFLLILLWPVGDSLIGQRIVAGHVWVFCFEPHWDSVW